MRLEFGVTSHAGRQENVCQILRTHFLPDRHDLSLQTLYGTHPFV